MQKKRYSNDKKVNDVINELRNECEFDDDVYVEIIINKRLYAAVSAFVVFAAIAYFYSSNLSSEVMKLSLYAASSFVVVMLIRSAFHTVYLERDA